MASDWYCNMSGDVSGPLTDMQLRELAAGGYLSPDDFVRKTAEGAWVSAGRVNGLFPTGESPTATGEEARGDRSTEGRLAPPLPVAKPLDGPPPVPPAKQPIGLSGIAPRDGLFAVDVAKTGASARSRRRRLVTSPPVLAISTALIVLASVMFWLSRTEAESARSDEDVSAAEAGSPQPEPKSTRQATFDGLKGLDIDELDRLISKPPDGPKTPKTDTAVEDRPADEAVTSLEPQTRKGSGHRETMVKVLEDDGNSPIPIPGLADVGDGDKPASDVEKR
jgi:uncharacterized protein DUF4339